MVDPGEEPTVALRVIATASVAPPTDEPVAADEGATASPSRRRLLEPRVVPLRAEQTANGYRSVHAALTRTPRSAVRLVGRGATELLITLGVVALLFAAYEAWGTARIIASHQRDLDRQLTQDWAGGASRDPTIEPSSARPLPPPSGAALARIYIPRLGHYWVVVEGVEPADLRFGPGHYPKSANPGQIGNFAIAGHRSPAVFWDLDQMQIDDPIVVETGQRWYVYRVTRVHITLPSAIEVLAPVPGQPGARPNSAMLTITTCNPKWSNSHRLIVHASLTRETDRSAGRPTELGTLS
jgi:sortase A